MSTEGKNIHVFASRSSAKKAVLEKRVPYALYPKANSGLYAVTGLYSQSGTGISIIPQRIDWNPCINEMLLFKIGSWVLDADINAIQKELAGLGHTIIFGCKKE